METETSKILVVEDDKPVRNLIATTLKMHGYSYLEAVNGTEALMMASSYNPSILLLDLGLPDMDGTEVIRQVMTQIRSEPWTQGRTTISQNPSLWKNSSPGCVSHSGG